MTLPVITTPQAEAQIRAIQAWWSVNRPAAPDLFVRELEHGAGVLAQAPKIGRPYRRHAGIVGLRRILLRASRYHVYYVVRPNAIEILAVWHAQRGKLPRL